MILDFHDGIPAWMIWFLGYHQATGNFMPGIDVGEYGQFVIRRVWFYHGGDYEESGVPYILYAVNRNGGGGIPETFQELRTLQSETTCNNCWEFLDLYWMIHCSSDEFNTVGLFVQPRGGTLTNSTPKLWIDASADHHHSACVLEVRDYDKQKMRGDRVYFELNSYNSDYGHGEVLIGMEIEGDFIVPVEESNFSTIKSLYR